MAGARLFRPAAAFRQPLSVLVGALAAYGVLINLHAVRDFRRRAPEPAPWAYVTLHVDFGE